MWSWYMFLREKTIPWDHFLLGFYETFPWNPIKNPPPKEKFRTLKPDPP